MNKILLITLGLLFYGNVFADTCQETTRKCIETRATKTINGVSVTRDCWKYGVEYNCVGSEFIDKCKILRDNSNCSQKSSRCDAYKNNICSKYIDIFECSELIDGVDPIEKIEISTSSKVSSEYVDDSLCKYLQDDSSCNFSSETCLETGVRTIDNQKVTRDCWKYKREYNCNSSGVHSDCAELDKKCQFKQSTCLVGDSSNCIKKQKTYSCTGKVANQDADIVMCGSQVYCENDDCDAIKTQQNKDLPKAATYINMLKNIGNDFNADNISIFTGSGKSCDKSAFGYNNCCKGSGWGMSDCSVSEKDLILLERQGQCSYIGKYCAKKEKLTGICFKNRHTSCCFKSKIARIIHQQGRAQLGIGFGSPQSPNCSGLTAEQISKIDFEKIDFSEVIQDAMSEVKDSPNQEELGALLKNKVNDFFKQYEKK